MYLVICDILFNFILFYSILFYSILFCYILLDFILFPSFLLLSLVLYIILLFNLIDYACLIAAVHPPHEISRNGENFFGYEKRAKSVYISKLWNGQYLHYDSSTNVHHNSIMADMMAGNLFHFHIFFHSFICRLLFFIFISFSNLRFYFYLIYFILFYFILFHSILF